ncbi:87ebe840-189a-4cb8-90ff-f578280db540 [Sclerotinia trifoliorum]|uniref:87ebe840-189a-4cb8-90ff-f578280db540 n=1 Tax=Sclerotinia trifoliorum TaxID=28548 RepID=A0A8H2ZL94_9HELO|nr:87ebe840-189a-4cb8-90ff-f578280db540 [Sclerotinia trifoliorum]
METGVPDGLFSWGAWPDGPNDMFTTTDYSYVEYLGGKPYMMPASPWFYTNLPGYHKNWLWRGDDMWFDRWTHIWYLAPEFVEILTWNDYGESHYIGPSRPNAWNALGPKFGKASYNYVDGFPHDGWRQFLPYVIDIYKKGAATISQEGVVVWFRPQPASACATGGTTGNTASQLQIQYNPIEIVQDKIFFTALLASSASVSVTVGGVDQGASWTSIPDGNVGLYHGSVSYKGTGPVVVTVSRDGSQIAQVSGGTITTACTNSIENWNPWVGSGSGASVSVAAPIYLSDTLHCVRGTGTGDYAELCALACTFDYCPTVCTCTQVGTVRTNTLKATGDIGCPAPGYDVTYEGLCSFGCNYGVCPKACTKIADISLCNPPPASAPPIPSCIAGTGIDTEWNSICSFTCQYNFCPNAKCICTSTGYTTNTSPTYSTTIGYPANQDGNDAGLCEWACNRGFCPFPPCSSASALAAIGEDVTTYPDYTKSKLIATSSQNSVGLLAYWTTCQESPQCAAGFQLVEYGHGKVYDADKNAYVADGCTGGSKGYNRAFCVESDVNLGQCRWRGKATSCKQTCLAGEYLLTQNTHIGGAKAGCKSGYFSSLCCEQITVPTSELTACSHTNLNNIVTGGHGPVVNDLSSSFSRRGLGALGSFGITLAECISNPQGNAAQYLLNQAVTNGAILNNIPGIWEPHVGGLSDFSPSENKAPSSSAKNIKDCEVWLEPIHEITTTVTSTIRKNCDEDEWPQACAHYYSAGIRFTTPIITCPYETHAGSKRPAPARWNSQHEQIWQKRFIDFNRPLFCQRDEYPPRAFMPQGSISNYRQAIRVLPRSQNVRAGQMWNRLCATKRQNVHGEGGSIGGGICQSTFTTSRSVNAMSIVFDVRYLKQYDTWLNVNPCSIDARLTRDPGFVLFADDPWYSGKTYRARDYHFYSKQFPSSLLSNLNGISNKKRSDDGFGSKEIDALALHGYRFALVPSSVSELNADFITVDIGNATRRATKEDIVMIFQILGWDFSGPICEEEEYSDYFCAGAPTVPGQFPTPTSEPPVTSLAIVPVLSSSDYSSFATSQAATALRPVITAAPSSKSPAQTESSKESKTSRGAEHIAAHKHAHFNHQHSHRHHRK